MNPHTSWDPKAQVDSSELNAESELSLIHYFYFEELKHAAYSGFSYFEPKATSYSKTLCLKPHVLGLKELQ